MDWAQEKSDWPHAGTSRFVLCKPHRWHIQETGEGSLLLLLHGAGGATQSFRNLIPLLAAHYRVIAVDLPGQGFTRLGAQARCGLNHMAEDLAALCAQESWHPHAIVGHSAGAALAFGLRDLLPPPPPKIIGINAALANFSGVAGLLFPVMAKTLAMMPGIAGLFTASNGNPRAVLRLIEGTGSTLPREELRHYRKLIADRGHVNATLQMMAQWDLEPLLHSLLGSDAEGLLIATGNDRAVPPSTSRAIAEKTPGLGFVEIPKLGHLAHEEAPEAVARHILDYLRR